MTGGYFSEFFKIHTLLNSQQKDKKLEMSACNLILFLLKNLIYIEPRTEVRSQRICKNNPT